MVAAYHMSHVVDATRTIYVPHSHVLTVPWVTCTLGTHLRSCKWETCSLGTLREPVRSRGWARISAPRQLDHHATRYLALTILQRRPSGLGTACWGTGVLTADFTYRALVQHYAQYVIASTALNLGMHGHWILRKAAPRYASLPARLPVLNGSGWYSSTAWLLLHSSSLQDTREW